MNSSEEQVRTAIAEQAGEWFVANDEGSLDARDAAALTTWLRTSPVHIEEFLGVSAVVRDLKQARTNPQYALEAILARARTGDEDPVKRPWRREAESVGGRLFGGWFPAAATMTVIALLGVALLLKWNLRPTERPAAPDGITALHFETRHGEQLTQRLADNSILHLNTDSAVNVRYSKSERFVTLRSGQASFEVAHEASRAFRVHAGSADITDLGTRFDVRLDGRSTVITVVEGRVAVAPGTSRQSLSPRPVELNADQQIRVADGAWPATPVAVDAERATAWLHRQIAFQNEPLEQVAAEYSRYTARPIEIATPALKTLRISGVFATDDTDAFIAFLRSLKGVRVEVTATRIRVSQD
jgi:transmembrane sensor